jgi:hypothetical protein
MEAWPHLARDGTPAASRTYEGWDARGWVANDVDVRSSTDSPVKPSPGVFARTHLAKNQ